MSFDTSSIGEGDELTIEYEYQDGAQRVGDYSNEIDVTVDDITDDGIILDHHDFEQQTTTEKESPWEGRKLLYDEGQDKLYAKLPPNASQSVMPIVGKNVRIVN